MKILIIINDHITYRTYIDTKAFSLINKNLVTYAINTTSNENNLKKIKIKNNCIKFDVNKKNDTLIFKISSLHFFSNLSKSLSYQYRFKRLLNFQVLYNSNYHIIKRIYLFFTNLLNKTSLWLLIILPIISLKTFRFYFYRYYLKKINIPNSIQDYFKNNKTEKIIVLIPSSGVDFTSIAIDKIKKEFSNVRDAILINNWDNVSSKGAFWHNPNLTIVWGKQQKEQARNILNIKKNIHALGSPSYINFFKLREKKIKRIYNFKYILFTGQSLQFDEISLLKFLDKIISEEKIKIKIIYRPHPNRHTRNCKDNFYGEKFSNIIMDYDAQNYYNKKESEIIKNYTSINYYPSLIKNAEFVIAPLTTMIIESLIFYKKILIIAHDDHFHYTSPYKKLKNMEHLQILKKFKEFLISYNNKDLREYFNTISNNMKKIDKKKYNIFLKNIIANPKNYDSNLKRLISKL